jgi:hypothetical protein
MSFQIGAEIIERDRRAETRDAALHCAAAAGNAYAWHLNEARNALMRDPSKALRNPHSSRNPTIKASDLLERLSESQQGVLADILSRAALAGDGMAQTLIDALAADHAELNCEEDEL